MSIEANIERIADALEGIHEALTNLGLSPLGSNDDPETETGNTETKVQAPPKKKGRGRGNKAEKPATTPAQKNPAPNVATQTAPATQASPEALAELQAHVQGVLQQLGPHIQRVPDTLKTFGVTKLSELPVDKYDELKQALATVVTECSML